MRFLLAAAVIASLLIAGCVVMGDDGTPAFSSGGGKKTVTPSPSVKTTPKATVNASVKPSPTPNATETANVPTTKPRCLITADPWLGTGPYQNSISVFFENIPANVTNATVKCTKAEKAHNETIVDGSIIFKCKYPQVPTQTNELASATAGKASCNVSVVIDAKPGPEIFNVNHSSINQTAVAVTWATNPASNGSINYGTTNAMSTLKNETIDWLASHYVVISKLTINATYYYRVTSCAKNAGCSQSGIYTFKVT